MSKPTRQALLIFTRNPEPGKCKTRLAAVVGNQAALEIYTFLVRHTAAVTQALSGTDKYVYYSEYAGDGSLWDPATFTPCVQQGPDLGARMEHAFRQAFAAGYDRVVLIGSDLYDLGTGDLESAFELLGSHEAVIGPATDGGYYLIGLQKLVPGLFKNKSWGQDTVLEHSLSDLDGLSVGMLPERNDVDYYEDIAGNPVFEPFLQNLPSNDT